MVEIKVNGVCFPAYVTMGAMLRFAELAGKEVTAIEADSLMDWANDFYARHGRGNW